MSVIALGLLISVISTVVVWAVFSFETNRGLRFGESLRVHADFAVLKFSHRIRVVSQFLGRDFIRQVVHYSFHSFLRYILSLVRKSEEKLHTVMRVNKTLAKNAERESVTRSKLEEIALHKVATALTEKQKKAHKDRSLNGM